MFKVICEKHNVSHPVETEQAVYKHMNVHREMQNGCDSVDYEKIE